MKEIITVRELAHKYYNLIYRKLLFGLNYNETEAEELTQEVFYELCKKWSGMRKESEKELKAWLLSTAQKKLMQFYRRSSKERKSCSEMSESHNLADQGADPYCQIINDSIMRDFDKWEKEILSQLSNNEIQLAKMIRKRIRYADIGKELGISEAAVTSRVYRLYKKVKELIAEKITKII